MLSKNSPTVTHDRENQCTVEEEVASLLKTLKDQVPLPQDPSEVPCKMPKAQRCHQTQSISQFCNNTPTSSNQNVFLDSPIYKNALKPYDTVWEKTCGHDADTLNRMRPWLPGPMVVKQHLDWTQPNQQMACPSDISANRLKELRRSGQTQEWPEIGQIGSRKESAMTNSFEAKSPKESSLRKESCTNQIPLLPPISPTSQRNYSPAPGDKVQVTVDLCLRILEWREQIKQPSPQKAHRDYVLFGIPPPRQ